MTKHHCRKCGEPMQRVFGAGRGVYVCNAVACKMRDILYWFMPAAGTRK